MELEEHTLEDVGDRCEECGVPLTEQEQQQQLVLEAGGPALCSVHAAELLVAEELDDEDGAIPE
jgi:hypothetical protein